MLSEVVSLEEKKRLLIYSLMRSYYISECDILHLCHLVDGPIHMSYFYTTGQLGALPEGPTVAVLPGFKLMTFMVIVQHLNP